MKSNFVLLVISLVVSLLLGEGLLRVLGYDPAFVNPLNSFHQADSELGWLGVPGFSARFQKQEFDAQVSANQEGFRALESPVKPNSNAKKSFFLGDSFTWGWGVSNGQVFTDVLQTDLGADYRLKNYGVNAYGNVQEFLLLERILKAGNVPDSVYVMLNSNDFSDNLDRRHLSRPYYEVLQGTPTLKNIPVEDPIGGWVKTLRRQSYLLTFLSYWINYYQATRDHETLQAEVLDQKKAKKSQASVSDNSYAVMRHVLQDFKSLCAEHDIDLHVVYTPSLRDFTDATPYGRAVGHISASLDISFIDLSQVFAPSPAQYYFSEDEHWNGRGHARAAQALIDQIK